MPTLLRKSLRDLARVRGQALGLALLVAVAVSLVAGNGRARSMLAAARSDCLARLAAADLEIRCSPTLPGALDAVADVPGIALAEERLLLEGLLRAPGVPSTPAAIRVLPASGRPRIYALEVTEGRWPAPGEASALIDRSVARILGIAVGDEIRLEVFDRTARLPVVGLTLGSEHLLHPAHPDFEIPIPGAMAAIQVSAAAGGQLPLEGRIDSLLFRLTQDADPDAVAARLLDGLGVAVLATLPASANPSQRFSRMLLDTYDVSAPAVTWVLLAVVLALFAIVLTRLVRGQRRQVGALLAVGQRPLAIALSLVVLSVVPALLGAVLGTAGQILVAQFVFDRHAQSVGWPPAPGGGLGAEAWQALLASVTVAVLACLIPAGRVTRTAPARLLRPQVWREDARAGSGRRGRGSLLRDRLRLPLFVLLGLRSVVRRRWATATSVIALAATLAVVLAFWFVQESHGHEIEASFDRLGLDGVAYLQAPHPEDELREAAPPAWDRIEATISRAAWFEFASGPAFLRITALQPDGWIRSFPIEAGRPMTEIDAPQIHVDRWVARLHDLEVGDRVTCYPYYSAPEGIELEVAGIFGGVSTGFAIVPLETGRRLFGLPGMATGLHVASREGREALIRSLRGLPDVRLTAVIGDARDHVRHTLAASRAAVALALFLAIVVAVVLLGILAALDVSERGRELGILRVLGWRQRGLLGLCMTEVVVRGYVAVALALPAAPFVARWILARISAANHYPIPLHDKGWMYAAIAALCAVLVPLGALPAWRSAVGVTARRASYRSLQQEA